MGKKEVTIEEDPFFFFFLLNWTRLNLYLRGCTLVHTLIKIVVSISFYDCSYRVVRPTRLILGPLGFVLRGCLRWLRFWWKNVEKWYWKVKPRCQIKPTVMTWLQLYWIFFFFITYLLFLILQVFQIRQRWLKLGRSTGPPKINKQILIVVLSFSRVSFYFFSPDFV